MSPKSNGREKFSRIEAPSNEDIEVLVERIASRLLRYLEKQGFFAKESFS